MQLLTQTAPRQSKSILRGTNCLAEEPVAERSMRVSCRLAVLTTVALTRIGLPPVRLQVDLEMAWPL